MKKLLSVGLVLLFMFGSVRTTQVFAWNSSRTSPSEITDPAYMWPAFRNGGILLEKKQGRLPAMGWNSWNAFGSGNTEALTRAQAEQFINLGLDDLGYEYIVLDDGCYNTTRDSNGNLTNNVTKFPSGFRALSDDLHEMGLKFGMYNDIGTNLCAGSAVGTVGYEDVDAQTYTDWGVDFLKVDNCYYLWDNATFSNGSLVQYAYTPRIRSITVTGDGLNATLNAVADGVLLGSGGTKNNSGDYVNNIGTADGTGTGRDMENPTWAELQFTVDAPADGTYNLVVNYQSGTSNGSGRWMQVAVGTKESEKRFFDNLVPASTDAYKDTANILVELKAGENVVRIMNHRRQENVLQSYSALLDSMNKANADNPDYDFLLSICEWGKTQPHEWGYKVGNSWRVMNDITFSVGNPNSYGSGSWSGGGTASILSQYNKAVIQDEYAGLDKGWNDPDMMVIGMNNITTQMSETHMTMWSMMNSPLMLGFDLRRVSVGDELHQIIANKDVIDLNQDPLGIQAKRVFSSATGADRRPDEQYITNNSRIDVLAKPLANGDIAVSFFNLDAGAARSASVNMDDILDAIGHKMVNADAFAASPLFFVKDLWTKQMSVNGRTFSVTDLAPTDNYTVRVSLSDDPSLIKDYLQEQIDGAEAELAAKSAPLFETPILGTNTMMATAIAEAQAVCDAADSSAQNLSDAINALAGSLRQFQGDYETLVSFKSTIDMAAAVVENADKYVQDDQWTAFVAVLTDARAAYDARESVAEIAAAQDSLSTARGLIHRILGESFGPVAWYIFDDPTATAAKDESGNGKDGLLLEGAKILPGNELRLENTGFVQLPAGMLSGEAEFTLAAWVKHYSYTNWARLFDFGMSNTNGYMFVAPSNGSGQLGFAITQTTNSAEQGVATARPATNEWSHLVVTQEGTTVRIYLNGVQVAVNENVTLNPASAIQEAANCYIGKSQWPDPGLNSGIKDVRIYDKPLSVEQIGQIMQDFRPVIASIAPVSVSAAFGEAPTLPARVNVTLDDGSTASVPVVWEEYDRAQLFMGRPFSIAGAVVDSDAIANPGEKTAEVIVSIDLSGNVSLNPDFVAMVNINDDPEDPFVDYTVANIGESGNMAHVIYAVYDKASGILLDTGSENKALAANGYAAGTLAIRLPNDWALENIFVKVFLWDMDYEPLMTASQLKLEPFASPEWTVVRPTAADVTKNSDQSMTVRTATGDLWNKGDNGGSARNIYLMDVPDDTQENFSATVKVTGFKPSQNYQRAALIVYTGDGNQVSVMRRFHSAQGNNVFQTTMNTNGSAGSESQYVADSFGDECLLRIDKNGAVITGYFSVDNGATWTQIPPDRTHDSISSAENIRIGFYASNGDQSATSVPVTFEDFTLNGKIQRFATVD